MKTASCTRICLAVVLLTCVLAAPMALAQVVVETEPVLEPRLEGFRLDGLVLEGGLAVPTRGENGFLFGVSAGMGTLFSRHLDFSVGLRRWSADIDRSEFGETAPGSFSDTSLDGVLAYPLMKVLGLRPYLGAGLAAHLVGADVPDNRSLEDALSGANMGALAVIGLGTTRPGLSFRLQARRDFVEDVGAWSYTMGVGWWPKQRAQKTFEMAPYSTGTQAYPVTSSAAPQYQQQAAQPLNQPAAPAPTAQSPADKEMVTALNHLKAQNEELAANMAKLQEQAAAEAAAIPVTPVPAPVAPVEVKPAPEPAPAPQPNRSEQLFDALQRVTALAGYPHSLSRTGNSGLLTLDQSLLFAIGKSELTTGAREELRRIGVVLLRFPEASVTVQGHTDSVGNPAANEVLSDRRAAAVRFEMLGIGLHPDSIRSVGYGDTRPVATNETADGRARNRRVDLQITMPSTNSN